MATLEQLENGLRKAHAAGNADHARAFAAEIRRMREAPADFGNVQGGSQTTETPPPPRTMGQEAGRSVGLGARGLIEGAAGLVGVVANPFITGANQFLGANQATMEQAGTALSDKLGLPAPETPTERVSSDITRSLVGGIAPVAVGRQMAAKVPGVVSNVGRALSSMAGRQVASAATGAGAAGATREAGGGQGAQVATGLLGGLMPGVGVAAGEGAIRRAIRGGEAGRQGVAQTISDFGRVGATPSVGQATQGRTARGIESLLSASPASSGVMANFAERQADDIGGGLQGMAEGLYRNASGERAGRAIERGVQTFAGNVAATKKALYWQADRFIPGDTPLPLSRTQMALANLTTPNQGALATSGALINPKVSSLAQNVADDLAANGGNMPYEAVKALRSRIGEELSDFSLTTDRPTREYKQLYAALSQDLEEAARKQGPQAEAAAKRANNYTRAAADRLEQVQRVVDKNGGPEKVYAAAMSGTRDGGTTLRAVMQSLDKEGQRAVSAAVIKRMGLATPGQQGAAGDTFSAQTFLTNWNNVSKEAKRALFDRLGPKYAADMDRVSRVAGNIRDGSKVFANPSGTANRAAGITYLGSLAGSLVTGQAGVLGTLLAGGAAANGVARLMTNPKFVGWLARATEMPVSAAPQQALILRNLANGDEDMLAVADALEAGGEPPQGQGN